MPRRLKIGSGFTFKRLDLAIKGLTNTAFLGNYKSAFKGNGLEFEDYRLYNSANDDASRIDWKASKRVGQTVIKEFREERDIDIIFLIDVSSTMLTGSTKKLKAEYAAEMIASIAQSVIFAGDSVGFTLFSDKIIKDFRPEKGLTRFYALTDELSKVNNYGGYSNADAALQHIFQTRAEGSLVILVSDFLEGIHNEHLLKLAAKKFDLIIAMIRDPRDMTLPAGSGEIFLEDPSTGSTILVRPEDLRTEFAREVNTEISRMRRLLKHYGADLLFLQTDKPFVKDLIKFFNRRAAEWR